MEILFLIPPRQLNPHKRNVDRVYGCNYGFDYKPPIHLLQLATISQNSGYKTRLLDCPAEKYNLKKLINFIKTNDSIRIVVIFTVWLSATEDLLAANLISEHIKNAKIFFTGTYPTWKPEFFLKSHNYFVIRGEPESSLNLLINAVLRNSSKIKKIGNLSFIENNKVAHTPAQNLLDIDNLPSPDYKLLKGKYSFNRLDKYPATVLCSSRGCKYNCTYCAPNAIDQAIELEHKRSGLSKPPLRIKSAQKVIEEFKAISFLGYKSVEICDNQFTWSKKRTTKICQAIKGLNLEWICYSRADHIRNKNMLTLMKSSGCSLIYIGTESFNQEILDDIGKKTKVSDNYKAINLVRNCNIQPEISVLLGGSMLETDQTASQTIKKAKKTKASFIHYAIASPLPNTKLYESAKEHKNLKYKEFKPADNTRESQLKLPYISNTQLKKIIRTSYLTQYLSPIFILTQLFQLNSLEKLKFRIKSLILLLKYLLRK